MKRKKVALCIDNEDYLVSLRLGKTYRVLREEDNCVVIIDETGEPYLYSTRHFKVIEE